MAQPNPNETGPGSGRRRNLSPTERRRRRRDWWVAGLVAALLAMLVTRQPDLLLFSRELPIGSDAVFLALASFNVLLIGLLVFLLARNVVKLVVERRRGIFGSKLNTRFVMSFLFVGAFSSTLLFLLSTVLVLRAINVWFELELSESLGQAIEVADSYYEDAEASSLHFARRIAAQVSDARLLREDALEELRALIEAKREEYDLELVEVFSAQLEELASSTDPGRTVVSFEAPDSSLVRAGLQGVAETRLGQAAQGELIRAAVPVYSTFNERDVVGVVIVNRYVPRAIGARVQAIREAIDAYAALQPSDGAFQANLVVVLAMITLSSVLFSSWIGFRLAKQVTEPIQRLAGATAEVGSGNLDVRIEQVGDDEIGTLVAEFNRMATDLSVSREEMDRRRTLMEAIVRSVAAGVLSLDADGIVRTINPSALRLLGVAPGDWTGRKVDEMLRGEALETLLGLLRRLAVGPQEMLRRQVPVTVNDEVRTLNWTASRIHDPDGRASGFVVVVDDVTQQMRAQRMAAWRDVARRIAHEIKNPLTPIQLSAQRLRRKLAGGLTSDDDRRLLEEATDAITGEVEAMKSLLTEFSNFARLPAVEPAPTDLNKLVDEAVEMYRGNHTIEFRTEVDPSLPMLDLDREQIKRVILNLLDNAMAAIDDAGPGPREIRVSTRLDQAVGTVQLEIADTGVGVKTADRLRLFEPYFSTKRQGSGLGLAIVGRIVSDHSGYIRVRANRPRGTRFVVELPIRT